MKYILKLAYKKLVIDRYTIWPKIIFFSEPSRGKLCIYISYFYYYKNISNENFSSTVQYES